MFKSHFNYNKDTVYLTLVPDTKKFNIMSTTLIKYLIDFINELYDSPVKVLRIFGEDNSFAVGADIKFMYSMNSFNAKRFSELANTLFNLLRDIPQVVIAEIDGYCMGGGLDFAAACDFRFATKMSKFSHPGAKLGFITGFGGTQRITRVMKKSYWKHLFFTGDVFDAIQMQEGDFILNTFDSLNEMRHFVDLFTQKISNKQKHSISLIKKAINNLI